MLVAVGQMKAIANKYESMLSMLNRIKEGKKVTVDSTTFFSNIRASIIDIYNVLKIYQEIPRDFNQASSFVPLVQGTMDRINREYKELRKDKERPLTDYENLLNDLKQAIEPLNSNRSLENLCMYNMGQSYLRNWESGGFDFDLPKTVLSRLMENYVSCNTEFNVVDLNTDEGENLLQIQEMMPKAKIYGVSRYNASCMDKATRAKFSRFILGGIEEAKISNDAFNMVIAAPPITFETFGDKVITTSEKHMLDRANAYLRVGGLMIMPIPECCITKEIATFFAKNLGDVQVFRDPVALPKVIVLMGKKRPVLERNLDPRVFTLLRNLIIDPMLADKFEKVKYELPAGAKEIQRFRSKSLDDGELNLFFAQSAAVTDFWKKQDVDKIADHTVHPLLPFNVGQLGLVLTSGCLDGVVVEPNGCSHVVKGRVIRVEDEDREYDDDGKGVEITTTNSSRVEISTFLPDGTFKCLA